MATERELRKRIKSVKNTSQITSALGAISASKANRAQAQVQATRAYAGKAFEILNNLAASTAATQHPLLTTRSEIKNTAIILITGDRGLAGSYNTDIVRLVERFSAALGHQPQLVTVGKKGRDLVIRRGMNVIASFEGIPDAPNMLDITPIAQVVVKDYLAGKVDEVFVAYTDFLNMVSRKPSVKQLLPLKPLDFEGMAVAEYVRNVDLTGVSERDYTYEPAAEALLNTIVPRFVDLQLYQSVLEAKASEHSARYVAMNNATDNAAVLIEDLTLERNKARQATITAEILDIVGGAEALAA
ncbi:MAG: ATP synthase F1 subunit gamma [Chloroflexi bacterium]|nr:ATP synthase F1 subunit gamma [Chloroflexota bacterium]MDA0243027.1 ATP synthase F1 subunit gamma [Chloroflexota bacterium]